MTGNTTGSAAGHTNADTGGSDLGRLATGIGALADETRRALYEYVVSQPDAVGREQAASATGLAAHNVNFHLDRLVAEGLLEVEFRRLSGRSGPGAGRPSKLYRRAAAEFAVSLPPRRYDLVGDILAVAVARAAGEEAAEEGAGGGSRLAAEVARAAHEEGLALAREADPGAVPSAGPNVGSVEGGEPRAVADELRAATKVLASQGYEPRAEGDVVTLANCPFDALAHKHTALVCGLNRDFVEGVVDGLGCAGVRACLEPHEDRCCVTLRPAE